MSSSAFFQSSSLKIVYTPTLKKPTEGLRMKGVFSVPKSTLSRSAAATSRNMKSGYIFESMRRKAALSLQSAMPF